MGGCGSSDRKQSRGISMKRKERLRKIVDSLATKRKLESKDIEARLVKELTKLAEELTR